MTISQQDITNFLKHNVECNFSAGDIAKALEFLSQQRGFTPELFLGAGNFGVVIYATNDNGQDFAIKIIITNQQTKADQVQREALIIKDVQSPYILEYVDHFQFKEIFTFFLVTEFCSEGNLQDYRKYKKDLSQQDVIKYCLKLLNCLKELERNGIIHLDLKPENILISGDGSFKVCDFGFAQRILRDKVYASKVGNLLYRAPEGVFDSNHINITSAFDIFSAGGIMLFICDPQLESSIFSIKLGQFPNFTKSKHIDVIKIALSMMTIEPNQRLGYNSAINKLTSLLPLQQNFFNEQSNEQNNDNDDNQEDPQEGEVDSFEDVRREVREMTKRLLKKIDEIFRI